MSGEAIMDDPEIPLRMHLERIIDERHRFYEMRFTEMEKHTSRTLAALTEGHHTMLSYLAIMLSVVAIALHFMGKG